MFVILTRDLTSTAPVVPRTPEVIVLNQSFSKDSKFLSAPECQGPHDKNARFVYSQDYGHRDREGL